MERESLENLHHSAIINGHCPLDKQTISYVFYRIKICQIVHINMLIFVASIDKYDNHHFSQAN